jgi:diaminopimelate epimerase
MKPDEMTIRFSKMHGLGNDFMVVDGVRQRVGFTPGQVRALADRHFGVGFDQLLLVETPDRDDVDFCYRIFNADGGEVEQCGNGARCFARFVHEAGLTQKREIRVRTAGGIITPRLEADGLVTVEMGLPRFAPAEIPFIGDGAHLVETLELAAERVEISVVNMGNPHAVLVVADVATAPVDRLGPEIATHPRFPERVNVGFMQVTGRHTLSLRVFERGTGETLSCGTGACAAVVTGIRRALIDSPARVTTRGGELSIAWSLGPDPADGKLPSAGPVFMTGPAVTVFTGEITL